MQSGTKPTVVTRHLVGHDEDEGGTVHHVAEVSSTYWLMDFA